MVSAGEAGIARPLRSARAVPAKPLGAALALIAAGGVLVAAATGGGPASVDTAFTTYCLGVLYIGALTWIETTRRARGPLPPWLSPPALIAGWTLAWIYAPATAAFFDPELLDELAVAQGGTELLGSGVFLACVAVTALWFAYHGTQRLAGGAVAAAPVRTVGLNRLVALYLLTVGARLLRISVLGFGFGADLSAWGAFAPVDQWIGYVEDLRYLVLALLVSRVVTGGTGRFWLAAAIAAEMVFAATSGFIKPFIWPVVVCVAAAAALDRIRPRHVAAVAVAIALVASFMNVVTVMRENWRGGIGTANGIAVTSSIEAGLQEVPGAGAVAQGAYRKFFGRQTEVAASTGLVVALTPAVLPFEGIGQFLLLPANLIPRALWPDKPVLSRGQWFSVQYRGLSEETTSSSAMTIFGEAYLFFGWTGVCLAMGLVGSILAVLFRGLNRGSLAPVYLALLPTILEIEPELSSYLTSLVQRSVVFVVVFLVFTHRMRPRP